MGLIHVLDEHTANQIAAGEVVERPASVVKELLENALDAAATRIEIQLIDGGKQKIKIVDNGCGMSQEDAALSIERHATSKISCVNDLLEVSTLGFRGEALPSIASVSKLEIITRRSGDNWATRIRVEGGQHFPIDTVGSPSGTSVKVEDLFFNTPARRKFLRSATNEGSACAEIVWRLALAHPHVAFILTQGRQVTFRSPGNNKPLETLSSVYGREIVPQLLLVSAQSPEGWELRGYIGEPSLNRANRGHQTWFVNHRWVRCRGLTNAVEDAYRGMLPSHRFPFFALQLALPPFGIDVNTHPTKQEIKMDRENELCDFVQDAVGKTLSARSLSRPLWLGNTTVPSNYSIEATRNQETNGFSIVDISCRQADNPNIVDKGIQETNLQYIYETKPIPSMNEAPIKPNHLTQSSHRGEDHLKQEKELRAFDVAEWIPIGQFQRSYIVAESDDALFLVDQHAAHERVLYHTFTQEFETSSTAESPSQQLLIPISVTLSPAEFQTVIEFVPVLRDVGVILEHFGGHTFLIRAVPVGLPPGQEEDFLRDVLTKLVRGGHRERESIQKSVRIAAISSLACRGAIKAGQAMSHAEMLYLLRQLAQLEGTDTCPHGRPYLIRIGRSELERKFQRS